MRICIFNAKDQILKVQAENRKIWQDKELALQVQVQLRAEMDKMEKEKEVEINKMAKECAVVEEALAQEKEQTSQIAQ